MLPFGTSQGLLIACPRRTYSLFRCLSIQSGGTFVALGLASYLTAHIGQVLSVLRHLARSPFETTPRLPRRSRLCCRLCTCLPGFVLCFSLSLANSLKIPRRGLLVTFKHVLSYKVHASQIALRVVGTPLICGTFRRALITFSSVRRWAVISRFQESLNSMSCIKGK